MLSNGCLFPLLLAFLTVEVAVALSGEDVRRPTARSRSGALMRTETTEPEAEAEAEPRIAAADAGGKRLERESPQNEKNHGTQHAAEVSEGSEHDHEEEEEEEEEDGHSAAAALLDEEEDSGLDLDADEELMNELVEEDAQDDMDFSGDEETAEGSLTLASNASGASAVELTDEEEAAEAARWVNMYVGCFADTGNRDLPVRKGNGGLKYCRKKCKGYTFFGRQWTNECWCGNTYGKWGHSNRCRCYGRNKGGWVNCVYRIVLPTTTTLSEAQKEVRDPKLTCKTSTANCKCAHRRRRRAWDSEDQSGRRRCTATNIRSCEREGDRCFKPIDKGDKR